MELLDGDFEDVVDAVGRGEFVIWAGSGISFGRVPDLRSIVKLVLKFVHERMDAEEPSQPYTQAFGQILQLGDPDSEFRETEISTPLADWSNLDAVLDTLVEKYSRVFDITVAGEPRDHLLWDGTDFSATFGADLEPDAEHLCIAMLMSEGVMNDVVTTNWDDLIEVAARRTHPTGTPSLRAAVRPEDFYGQPTISAILKYHGCARKAIENETQYRDFLKVSASQIESWLMDPNDPVLQRLKAFAIDRPSLLVGMSTKDTDTQVLFQAAFHTHVRPWPDSPPAVVFSEEEGLGDLQNSIMQAAYGNNFASNKPEIEAATRFPGFARPLLLGLVLEILSRKLIDSVKCAGPNSVGVELHNFAEVELKHLRDAVASLCGEGTSDVVWRLIRSVTNLMQVARLGELPHFGSPVYRPLTSSNLADLPTDPLLPTSALSELGVTLALLSAGGRSSEWTVDFRTIEQFGYIRIETVDVRERRVFFFAHEGNYLQALEAGVIDADADAHVALLGSQTQGADQRPTPGRRYGRTGKAGASVVSVGNLLSACDTTDDLKRQFYREVVA